MSVEEHPRWQTDIREWERGAQAGLAGKTYYLARFPTAVAVRSQGVINLVPDSTFAELASTWRSETGHLSSITQKAIHPAYQRIIGMGERALPLILRELQARRGHWFWALHAITGEDPVPPEDAGDVDKMRDAWLELGRIRGWL
jgi:hypothetical protein